MQEADILLNRFFLDNGWNIEYLTDGGMLADKVICFPHLKGQLSKGHRLVTMRIDHHFRYMEAIDGWSHVMADIDLREFIDVAIAVETLLKKAY